MLKTLIVVFISGTMFYVGLHSILFGDKLLGMLLLVFGLVNLTFMFKE